MPEKLRVLLVDDHQESADSMQRTLGVETSGVTVTLERVDRLERALARLEGMAFDAIFLELNLPDSRGVETLTRLRPHRGEAALLVWTAMEEEETAFAALRAGVEDYLVKGDVAGPALMRRLRLAIERRRSLLHDAPTGSSRPVVVGFGGVKGGAGTTTVAVNVAAALAKQNRSTLLIELKPDYGVLSYQLKHTPAANLSSLRGADPADVNEDVVSALLCTLPLGMRVLFGPQRPEQFGDLDPHVVEALIKTASRMAERVVIDLPPAASTMIQPAIRQCHFVSMVLERDAGSVHAAKAYQERLHVWGISQLITGAVVVNRSMSQNPLPITDLPAQLGCVVLGAVPPAIDLCTRCHQAGSPAILLEPQATFSSLLTELTQRLFEHPSLRAARSN